MAARPRSTAPLTAPPERVPRSVQVADRRVGIALVVVAASVVQIGAGVAKKLFAHVGPGGTVLLRCSLAAIVLGLVVRPRFAALRWPTVLFGLATGLMNFSFYQALDRLPLGLAVAIEFLGPLCVAMAGYRRARDGLWVMCAAFGVALLTPLTGAHLDSVGIAFALGAGALWAAYIVLGERVSRVSSGPEALALSLPFAVGVVAVFGVHDGGWTLLRPSVLAAGFVVAMCSAAIPYTMEIEALRRIPKATFGLLMSLEPAIAATVGLVVLGEHLTPREIAAIALILAANAGSIFLT